MTNKFFETESTTTNEEKWIIRPENFNFASVPSEYDKIDKMSNF